MILSRNDSIALVDHIKGLSLPSSVGLKTNLIQHSQSATEPGGLFAACGTLRSVENV